MNIRTIAKITGYSPSTVSRVLSGNHGRVQISEKTCKKVLSVCDEFDYEPDIHASRLFSKKTGIIGMLIPDQMLTGDENLAKFMNGVYNELSKFDYRLLVMVSNKKFMDAHEYTTIFRRREVDALIIWGIHSGQELLDELNENNYPFILSSNIIQDYPYVTCDDENGVKMIVRHCREQGAEKFIFVSGGAIDISLRRKKGFLAGVEDLSYKIIEGDLTMQGGFNAVKGILEFNPDAVICANDKTASSVIMGLKEQGIDIPSQIMVAGGDNVELSEFVNPTLTTFDQMAYENGCKCVDFLLEHLTKNTPVSSMLIKPRLYFRKSTDRTGLADSVNSKL